MAPASSTLPERPTEPQRRVSSSSSHSSQATLPRTRAASAADSGSHPSALAPGMVATRPLTGSLGRAVGRPVVVEGHLAALHPGDAGGSGHPQPVEQLEGVDGAGDGQGAHRVAGGAAGVGEVAVVAGRGDGEHAVGRQLVDHGVLGVVDRRVVGAEREVDDVEVVGEVAVTVGVQGPVERLQGVLGGALAAEHLQAVERGSRGRAGADLHGEQLLAGQGGVVAGEGGAAGRHAVARGRAGDVRAVVVAVQRVGVGLGDRILVGVGAAVVERLVGPVVVAHEVGATADLGPAERPAARRASWGRSRRPVRRRTPPSSRGHRSPCGCSRCRCR